MHGLLNHAYMNHRVTVALDTELEFYYLNARIGESFVAVKCYQYILKKILVLTHSDMQSWWNYKYNVTYGQDQIQILVLVIECRKKENRTPHHRSLTFAFRNIDCIELALNRNLDISWFLQNLFNSLSFLTHFALWKSNIVSYKLL